VAVWTFLAGGQGGQEEATQARTFFFLGVLSGMFHSESSASGKPAALAELVSESITYYYY
jgi:hypothetical protein